MWKVFPVPSLWSLCGLSTWLKTELRCRKGHKCCCLLSSMLCVISNSSFCAYEYNKTMSELVTFWTQGFIVRHPSGNHKLDLQFQTNKFIWKMWKRMCSYAIKILFVFRYRKKATMIERKKTAASSCYVGKRHMVILKSKYRNTTAGKPAWHLNTWFFKQLLGHIKYKNNYLGYFHVSLYIKINLCFLLEWTG